MDGQFIDWFFKGLTGILMTVIGWIWVDATKERRLMREEMKAIQLRQSNQDIALYAHKLEAERTYAKDSSLQSSLARIHDRMDMMSETIDDKMSELQRDIKLIISKVK